ncbi:MAG: peptidylprolyl isomerase [Alphaproteobacteria bacterium]|nr:peptidylprolyl isomerase [Alphaproteobacteria bacterium]
MRVVCGLLALPLLAAACSRPAPTPETAAAAPSAPAIPGPPEGLTPSVADIVAASKPEEWRALDPETTLYMDFPVGRVVIEMAPQFAPNHVANVKVLSREGYFVNGAVTRVQDNYVAQWSQGIDPPRPPKVGKATLKGEFTRPRDPDVPFTVLPDPDTYAPEVGFSNGFAAARDATSMWLTHCYGTVGVGRDNDDDSGGGTELYAIIGQSPRMLDRNITVLGRVVQGMELLSSLPRGTGEIGFYKTPQEYVHFADIKVAADVPEAQRTNLEVMRTDSDSFATLVNSRRWRKDAFYHHPVGRIGLCNISVPVRAAGVPK